MGCPPDELYAIQLLNRNFTFSNILKTDFAIAIIFLHYRYVMPYSLRSTKRKMNLELYNPALNPKDLRGLFDGT